MDLLVVFMKILYQLEWRAIFMLKHELALFQVKNQKFSILLKIDWELHCGCIYDPEKRQTIVFHIWGDFRKSYSGLFWRVLLHKIVGIASKRVLIDEDVSTRYGSSSYIML